MNDRTIDKERNLCRTQVAINRPVSFLKGEGNEIVCL